MNRGHRPLVGVTADFRSLPDHPHQAHLAGETYLRAVSEGAGAYPVVLPALSADFDVLDVLGWLDGLLLTGSPSNLDPGFYAGEPSRQGTWHDPRRDRAVMALIPAAIQAGIPLLAICRGFQELNVAFGGSLHQHVREVPGYLQHRQDEDRPLEEKYGSAHDVELTGGGVLASIIGETRITVNSLHSQGADRLGDGLRIEAVAPDGLVEAVSAENARGFALAVQWHPEWDFGSNPVSAAIFRAFGNACRSYRGSA